MDSRRDASDGSDSDVPTADLCLNIDHIMDIVRPCQTHMLADRQTDTQTCSLQYFATAAAGEVTSLPAAAVVSLYAAV